MIRDAPGTTTAGAEPRRDVQIRTIYYEGRTEGPLLIVGLEPGPYRLEAKRAPGPTGENRADGSG